LTPRDGRPFPADAHSNDLLHWHNIGVSDAEAVRQMRSRKVKFVSTDVIEIPAEVLGFKQAFDERP